ncbi:hypothetical protein HYZ98_02000 [Candidatus Peregrinibacteria bacterium]|nr:hypothetical protein [Candidatus Peregrinibacteria bacterium]
MQILDTIFRLLSVPQAAHADVLRTLMGSGPGVGGMFTTICNNAFCQLGSGSGSQSVFAVVRAITLFISSIIGGTAVAVLVYAGIKISMSRGNAEGLNEGKKIAMWALLGVAIAIVAPAVMNWVEGAITAATN